MRRRNDDGGHGFEIGDYDDRHKNHRYLHGHNGHEDYPMRSEDDSEHAVTNNHLIFSTRPPSPNATNAKQQSPLDKVKFIRRANITAPNEDYEYYYYYYYDYVYPDDDEDGEVVEHLPKPSYFSDKEVIPLLNCCFNRRGR